MMDLLPVIAIAVTTSENRMAERYSFTFSGIVAMFSSLNTVVRTFSLNAVVMASSYTTKQNSMPI